MSRESPPPPTPTPRAAVPCPGATQALIRGRSLRTIDVPHIGWLQLIDELSEGSNLLKKKHFQPASQPPQQ